MFSCGKGSQASCAWESLLEVPHAEHSGMPSMVPVGPIECALSSARSHAVWCESANIGGGSMRRLLAAHLESCERFCVLDVELLI